MFKKIHERHIKKYTIENLFFEPDEIAEIAEISEIAEINKIYVEFIGDIDRILQMIASLTM